MGLIVLFTLLFLYLNNGVTGLYLHDSKIDSDPYYQFYDENLNIPGNVDSNRSLGRVILSEVIYVSSLTSIALIAILVIKLRRKEKFKLDKYNYYNNAYLG